MDVHTGAVPSDVVVIVLTGGTGARLGGADKATLVLHGATPLSLIVDALPGDVDIVVSGPPLPLLRQVTFRQEQPPGGGPVAGIAAALDGTQAPLVGVIAVDMPWAVPVLLSAIDRLRESPDTDVAVPIDRDGRRQPLCCAWRADRLRACLPANTQGAPVRALLQGAVVLEFTPGTDNLLDDIDTPDDLERALRRSDP